MFEVDFARGIAYQGSRGFIIRMHPKKGLYIRNGLKIIFLTKENTKIMGAEYETVNI